MSAVRGDMHPDQLLNRVNAKRIAAGMGFAELAEVLGTKPHWARELCSGNTVPANVALKAEDWVREGEAP